MLVVLDEEATFRADVERARLAGEESAWAEHALLAGTRRHRSYSLINYSSNSGDDQNFHQAGYDSNASLLSLRESQLL